MSEDKISELKVPAPDTGVDGLGSDSTSKDLPIDEKTPQEKEIEALKAEVADLKDKYLRALAESKNTVMRAQKDRTELLKYEGEKIFRDIVEVADNLERALSHSGEDAAKIKDGLSIVNKQLLDTLSKWGVVAEDSKGKPFSPERHFALSKVVTTEQAPGTIVDQLVKPYFYKDKLLRPGQVVVAAKE
jgi:molecular chaperone GrpE